MMTDELVLAWMARDWAEQLTPGDRRSAERATAIALRCLAGGASFAEASTEARRFVQSWARHPSHSATHPLPVPLAS